MTNAQRARNFGIRLEADARQTPIDYGGHLHRFVQTRTPVATGRTQASTITTINAPSDFEPPSGLNKYPSSTEDQADSALQALVLGDTFYLTQNVNVPSLLEDGRSQQAPGGYWEISITDADIATTAGARP